DGVSDVTTHTVRRIAREEADGPSSLRGPLDEHDGLERPLLLAEHRARDAVRRSVDAPGERDPLEQRRPSRNQSRSDCPLRSPTDEKEEKQQHDETEARD